MQQITLKGTNREIGNKALVKAVRRDNLVPCVYYGNGVENTVFSVALKDLETILNTPNSYIIEIDIEGKKQLAVLQAVQFHPVTDKPLHVDFLAIQEDKPVTINIPVVITGNSIGVRQGGKLMVSTRKLKVSGMMKDLPDTLPVDITELNLGKQIVAGDLHYDNIQIMSPKATIVCSVKMTRAAASAAADAQA
ncbi:MAG: 50S ribosomal protein L25 [Bacteroidetes bacterium]|uniref:Large ribosomal subunit protein bL25 n=1 Tax=Candidatus Merdivivens pullistercoris TaxID=2840873 RepID=A0A9D9N9Q0_9BACT|nr:50S ribosomal protein L25 [Candidatus Merdivivens pullistercoris]